MSNRFKFAFSILFAGSVMLSAITARADDWNKETVMTFTAPFEVPGQVLPAGTYVFKLADSDSDREIVQIFSEDQKQLLATILATAAYRLEPTDNTVVTFEERGSGSPEALHRWFYAGDTAGVEFVYAKPTEQVVAEAQQSEPTPTSVTAAPEPNTDLTVSEPQPTTTVEEEDVLLLPEATPALPAPGAPPTAHAPAATPETLPKTAGNFAAIPLIGLLLLSAGFATIRMARWQS